VDYKALPITGATEQWDPVAQAGYSYDPVRKVLNTYDVPQAVKAKCQYVIQKGLGGVIIWESTAPTRCFTFICDVGLTVGSADAPYGTSRSLLQTIHDNLLIFNPGGAPSPSNPAPGSSTSNFPSQTNPGTNINQQPINPVSPNIPGQSGSILPWNPSTYYSVGSLVTYNGITYKCIQAHQAQLAWNPAIVPALWQPVS
jgi:chitinase